MKKSSNWIILCLICVTLLSPILFSYDTTLEQNSPQFHPPQIIGGVIPRSSNGEDTPIEILNNSDLALACSSGDGESWETAYIIENLNLSVTNSTFSLFIANTTKFCIIRNCSITNTNITEGSSIFCNNSTNIRMINNTISNGFNGIRILDGIFIQIQNNAFNNNINGINGSNSGNIIVSQNSFIEFEERGIYFHNSSNLCFDTNHYVTSSYGACPTEIILIVNCVVRNEVSMGERSSYIARNCENLELKSSTLIRIFIFACDNFTIKDCIIIERIRVLDCLDFSLVGNIIQGKNGGVMYAIELSSCYNYNVTRNTLKYYSQYAILITTGEHTEIPDFQPEESTEIIENNVIYLKGYGSIGYLMRGNSVQEHRDRMQTQKLGWNWIIPPISYIVMCVTITFVIFLLMRTKYKIFSIKEKLEKTKYNAFGLISNTQSYFFYQLIKMGLIFGCILIPLTFLHIYRTFTWGWWIFEMSATNMKGWGLTSQERFFLMEIISSVFWVGFFVLYFAIIRIKTRPPKIMQHFKSELRGSQKRNLTFAVLGTIILLLMQTVLILFGLWFYLGYFYGFILLVGFIKVYFFDTTNLKNKLSRKFLMTFVFVIISQVIIHLLTSTADWPYNWERELISFHLIRWVVIVASLKEWRRGNEKN